MSSDIELEIGAGPSPDEFTIRVVRAVSGGEQSANTRLDVDGILRGRDALESTVLASAVAGRRIASAGERQLQQVGRQLFEALFSGPVYGAYRASLGAAQQQGERLRVVLRLTAPRLAALPWEALFDPETGTYICRKEPLVRHVPAPYTPEPLEVVLPLRVLGLVASPRGLPTLDVVAEQAHLSQALAGPISAGLIELVWLTQASWEAVQEKLLSEQWHVLHFIGHGDYDVANDQGLIALVGSDGRANLVGADQLADLLNEAHPTPRLVVLNSCSSGEQGTQDLFSGTAAALVRSGISAVAAMQFTVSDAAAIAFATGFYTAIAHGHSVDDATRSGRVSILGAPGTLEWVTPVLYVRGDTTVLFHVAGRSPEPMRTAAPPQTETSREHPGPLAVGQRIQSLRERMSGRVLLVSILAITGVLVAVAVASYVYVEHFQHRSRYRVIATVPVASNPRGVALDGATIYVTHNNDNGTVSVLDGSTDKLLPIGPPIAVGAKPAGVAVDPATRAVYVANFGSGTVSVIERSSTKAQRYPLTTTTDSPSGIAVGPKSIVYVTLVGGERVAVMKGARTTFDPVVPPIAVGVKPNGVAVDWSTGTAYVTNYGSGTVSVIDGHTYTRMIPDLETGGSPDGVAVDPDPNTPTIYVANNAGKTVWVIDGRSHTLIAPVDVGLHPNGIAVDPVTRTVYVTNEDGRSVSVIDGRTHQPIDDVAVDGKPEGVAVDPVTHKVYVAVANGNAGSVSVIQHR
ncbi:CHAT domain-containing protein [Mycobacterium sp. CVI_P3]|uniref:CHAT domain-containing protein n=2 Tax=Mycobacterium pinniadriaticum TaxID=2994102 RepID=A0ABT3SFC1_9MYCO|nr:CHAT domain-containing protein [Mycobacterium pinniadriaticum]MCX2931191.1 CHAT domain-containing protein [Mycobacterium pinniadriaticum]MCX2937585.1 CHAT domain-containing protein [Mycobacterium pinniadriaticum]